MLLLKSMIFVSVYVAKIGYFHNVTNCFSNGRMPFNGCSSGNVLRLWCISLESRWESWSRLIEVVCDVCETPILSRLLNAWSCIVAIFILKKTKEKPDSSTHPCLFVELLSFLFAASAA